jgi:hypothetical protein
LGGVEDLPRLVGVSHRQPLRGTGRLPPPEPTRYLLLAMNDIDPDDDSSFEAGLEELERLSNGVLDLIDAGRFDDAERACLELERRYPDQIDGIDRAATLSEARGDARHAIELYRRCLDFIDRNPDGFDEESKGYYRDAIANLESRLTR